MEGDIFGFSGPRFAGGGRERDGQKKKNLWVEMPEAVSKRPFQAYLGHV